MNHAIEHLPSEHKGMFVIRNEAGKRIAELTYSVAGSDKIIIDHTGVDDSLRGTGAGYSLVEAAMKWAKALQYEVIPLCPFAKATLEKHPELRG